MYENRKKRPVLFGKRGELKIDVDDVDPARLGSLSLRDGRASIEIEDLSPSDLKKVRRVLRAS